jgi:hypothetical protein
MANASQVQEHMEVVGSDGQHVGTVDKLEGDRIKLTRNDPAAGGEHHYLSVAMLDKVDGSTVRLNQPAADVMRQWSGTWDGAG